MIKAFIVRQFFRKVEGKEENRKRKRRKEKERKENKQTICI